MSDFEVNASTTINKLIIKLKDADIIFEGACVPPTRRGDPYTKLMGNSGLKNLTNGIYINDNTHLPIEHGINVWELIRSAQLQVCFDEENGWCFPEHDPSGRPADDGQTRIGDYLIVESGADGDYITPMEIFDGGSGGLAILESNPSNNSCSIKAWGKEIRGFAFSQFIVEGIGAKREKSKKFKKSKKPKKPKKPKKSKKPKKPKSKGTKRRKGRKTKRRRKSLGR